MSTVINFIIDIFFSQLGKNATLPKSKKRETPKKPFGSESVAMTGEHSRLTASARSLQYETKALLQTPGSEIVYCLVQEVCYRGEGGVTYCTSVII